MYAKNVLVLVELPGPDRPADDLSKHGITRQHHPGQHCNAHEEQP